MDYQCTTENTPPQLAVSIRLVTPVRSLILELQNAYRSISTYLLEIGEKPSGPFFAAYYNWDKEKLDVEVGFLIQKKIPDKENIQLSEIPGGSKANTLYKGPYNRIAPAYKFLNKYITDNGYTPGVNYEFYINFMENIPDAELLTKIVYLLKE